MYKAAKPQLYTKYYPSLRIPPHGPRLPPPPNFQTPRAKILATALATCLSFILVV